MSASPVLIICIILRTRSCLLFKSLASYISFQIQFRVKTPPIRGRYIGQARGIYPKKIYETKRVDKEYLPLYLGFVSRMAVHVTITPLQADKRPPYSLALQETKGLMEPFLC